MASMNKLAVHQITDTLGASEICEALDVTPHSIRHARTTGSFSASWYDALFLMCHVAGIQCPRDAFNWKSPAKKDGNPVSQVQGLDSKRGA